MENKTQISGEQGILNESSILNIFASSFFWGGGGLILKSWFTFT